jgi:hypothetical protein
MRPSAIATILSLLCGLLPVTASAQQTTPDANQPPPQVRPGRAPQDSDQVQTQNSPVQPERTPQQSGQAQTQNTPVQPERTPQQSDRARDGDRRSAEDARINRDWTTRQRSEERMDMDRTRQRQMGRMMDPDEDHRNMGRTWRRDYDDMDGGPRYGSDRSEGRYYYEIRPRPRVKTCIEYENGDEFCRYRD